MEMKRKGTAHLLNEWSRLGVDSSSMLELARDGVDSNLATSQFELSLRQKNIEFLKKNNFLKHQMTQVNSNRGNEYEINQFRFKRLLNLRVSRREKWGQDMVQSHGSNTSNSLLIKLNPLSLKDLVKISASCLLVHTKSIRCMSQKLI